MLLLLYLCTPSLGFLRNYVKYKQVNIKMFLRTPLTYSVIHFFLCISGHRNIVLKTLISERWFFFIYKTYLSLKNNDYMKNKEKYIKKYELKYKSS